MDWRGIKFIATTKAALKRQIDALGIVMDPDAAEAFEALLDTFQEWIQDRGKDKC